jgi:hypothetical protein
MARKGPYAAVPAGLWKRIPVKTGYHMGCCDCGLVHRFEFRVGKGGHVWVASWRDEKETAYVRKRFRRKFTKRRK